MGRGKKGKSGLRIRVRDGEKADQVEVKKGEGKGAGRFCRVGPTPKGVSIYLFVRISQCWRPRRQGRLWQEAPLAGGSTEIDLALPPLHTQVHPFEYDLVLHPDINTRGHIQWFYFAVSNTRRGAK